MSTVIDSLIVELGLDPKQFTDAQRQTLEDFQKGGKQLQASGKQWEEVFSGVKNAALGLFTVLVGTDMVDFARRTMTAVSATGRLAHNIGVGTSDLSAFTRMIERNGGSADEAAGSMQNLTQQVERFKVFGEASDDFQMFLGTIGQTNPNATALDDYMKFAEWADQHKNDPQLINLIGAAGGLDQGSINEATKGLAQVREDLAKVRATLPSDADVLVLQRMQDSWTGMDQAIGDVGRDLLVDVAPAFTSIAGSSSRWIENNRQIADSLGAILTALVGLLSLKPAAWLLRLLGIGAASDAVAGGAAAGGALLLIPLGVGLGATALNKSLGITSRFKHGVDVPTPAAAGNTVQDRALAYFKSQGWTTEQAAGIVAQAQAESSFDPSARNAGHGGLFQWDKSRRDAILAGTGIDVYNASIDDQLKAAQWELTHTEGAAGQGLREQTSAGAAATYLDRNYERSGDSPLRQRHRALLAEQFAASAGEDSSTSVVINGDVLVNAPKATDADGIARDFMGSLKKAAGDAYNTTVQANTGLN
jgi:hypothetical protein